MTVHTNAQGVVLREMTNIINTFLGWPTYPALFTCSYCGETCDIDYAYEHDYCEQEAEQTEEQEEEL